MLNLNDTGDPSRAARLKGALIRDSRLDLPIRILRACSGRWSISWCADSSVGSSVVVPTKSGILKSSSFGTSLRFFADTFASPSSVAPIGYC